MEHFTPTPAEMSSQVRVHTSSAASGLQFSVSDVVMDSFPACHAELLLQVATVNGTCCHTHSVETRRGGGGDGLTHKMDGFPVKGQKSTFLGRKDCGGPYPPMNSIMDTKWETQVSKFVRQLVRHENSRERETGGAIHWKFTSPKLRFKFRSDGGNKFTDRDWINFIWKGSCKTRFQFVRILATTYCAFEPFKDTQDEK